MPDSMDTERDAIEALRADGYTHEFFIEDEGVRCPECDSQVLPPEAVTIDQTYRFEGASDPDDMSIVFAVSEGPCGLKGVLVLLLRPRGQRPESRRPPPPRHVTAETVTTPS